MFLKVQLFWKNSDRVWIFLHLIQPPAYKVFASRSGNIQLVHSVSSTGRDPVSRVWGWLLNRGTKRWTAEPAKVRNYTKMRNKGILRNRSILIRSTRRSISTAIRGSSVIDSLFFVCMSLRSLSYFPNFQISQSGPIKPAPATCFYYICSQFCQGKGRDEGR